MLPKKYRLNLKTEFLRIKESGRYLNGGLVTILYAPSPALKFGFIVTNKISKKSAKRNRVKRLLREATRGLIPEIKKNYNFVIIAKPKIVGKGLIEIKKELRTLIFKAINNQITNNK